MDSMQASLEAESRAKAEALRIKKKLESDINELEIALDHANKANAEAQKSIKRYQNQLREVEGALEEEHRQHVQISEKAGLAERKANALHGELEESRALLDSADRGKKQCEMELSEARSAVNDMTAINSKAMSEKRHLESACHTLHAEIDDLLHQAKNSEDKAKKAMVDAARLADELRAEQDHASNQEKAKRTLETQINELENRLAEANEMAMKGGRAAMAKLESRIREMEIELRGGLRSSNSSRRRIRRTRTRCLTSPRSSNRRSRPTRSRSRRLRRSLPLTWPSTGRPNRSWRKLKTVPRWLRLNSPSLGLDLPSCKDRRPEQHPRG